jgi:RsiW-degrading membrane proteinase PrsW (M82 family)
MGVLFLTNFNHLVTIGLIEASLSVTANYLFIETDSSNTTLIFSIIAAVILAGIFARWSLPSNKPMKKEDEAEELFIFYGYKTHLNMPWWVIVYIGLFGALTGIFIISLFIN